MDKKEISDILKEIGILLELKGENPFKVRAYLNAARSIEMLDDDIEYLVETEGIKDVKGIGKAIVEKITTMVRTGDLPYYRELKSSIPSGLLEMLNIPGLGPKKIHTLYKTLGISTVSELEYSCHENRLLELKGFGEKTQDLILRGIESLKKFKGLFLYEEVIGQAMGLLEQMKECTCIKEISIAGSIRRHMETVKDIDLVASSLEPEKVMAFFRSIEDVMDVKSTGPTKTSVLLESGISADLRVVSPGEFAYALHHFTGSREHNTAMRHRAKNMGMKINEYGLFKGEERLPADTEHDFFKLLCLQYIPPELRENMGEIEASEKNILPDLVQEKDIQGAFHVHTIYSDGLNTIEEMVEKAKMLGFKYIGISDHSQSAYYAGGLSIKDVIRQREEIDRLNAGKEDFHIFHGIESDILPDGSLDYPDEILSIFDFVIASVHSSFSITGKAATERLVKAMQNPHTTMLGHPTGRLLLGRNGYAPDMFEVIKAASQYDVIIEFNANPQRLDIDWRYMKYAKQHGVMISINPDAHRKHSLIYTLSSTGTVRKGWIEKKDVFNCLPLKDVIDYFQKKP